ncbi:MAG: serine/threonine-protein kinase [Isosphaeraceae bacterium]|nr:serine/threonine-protein kinase [Isosphaeraceae bacterium]
MATSLESNPPAKDKDSKGLSSLNEFNLEKSILRRGLATANEIELCKAHKAKLAGDSSKSLLDIMVEARVLTKNQCTRLLREMGESTRKLDIPGYQIIEKLGKGSMGIVYKARQTSVDRIVAVKILLDALAQNKEFIKRFDREAKIAAKLSHNNIVNAIDAGEMNGYHFFVMEYVEGSTIKDALDRNEVYDEKTALRIVLAVAEALKHAHQRGLIHRDIKPENVILTKDGNVKLADLGLARLTADEKWAMSEAGMAIGTPYYISPEQVRGQVDVDIRADIYSLGATLYHMVTGHVPYSGDTPSEVMRKHVDKNVMLVPPDHLNTHLSSGLGMVVETMMAKNRENRYRNPDDLILDLKCLIQGESPMLAGQKPDTLAVLAEGETKEGAGGGHEISDAIMAEWAGYVNGRNSLIAALAMLLALSIVTNVVFLATR